MLNRLESNAVSKHSISSQKVPTVGQRQVLEDREAALQRSIMPGDAHAMAAAISTMFLGFPMMRIEPDAARTTVALYVSAVARYPTWAVQRACRALVEAPDARFVPNCGPFKAACKLQLRAVTTELAEIERILKADVYPDPGPEERAGVTGKFDGLAKELGLRASMLRAAERPKGPRDAREAPAPAQSAIRDPQAPLPGLSPEALRKMGVPQVDRVPSFEEQMD